MFRSTKFTQYLGQSPHENVTNFGENKFTIKETGYKQICIAVIIQKCLLHIS